MSNSIVEIEDTDCIFVFGYNAADSHPIVARRIIKAKAKGAKIIVCDPRRIETARIADIHVPLKNGSNIAFLNAMAQVIIAENLHDRAFIEQHTEAFETFRDLVATYTPESVEETTGISAQMIRETARMYAKAPTATILWGMGVTQFYQGVETVRTLTSIALLTGNLGKPYVGVGPVRGQNNVQGACDMGALPNTFPGYQYVNQPEVLEKFAKAWGVEKLNDKIGYALSEVPHNIEHGLLKAHYVMGEDPLQTEPDLATIRRTFEQLDLLIVQDIFMTKTAAIADVIFPATSWGEHEGVYTSADRGFQRFYKAVEPEGDVKRDWEIISLMSTAMGYPMHYHNTQEIWDELRELCPIYYGATYEKMADLAYVQWPCPTLDSPGTQYLYQGGKFDTPNGKGQFFTCEWRPPIDRVSDDYPLVLATVREVGHYSCRSMTGNCKALAALADEPGYVQINTADAKTFGIRDQDLVWIRSRQGKVISRASVSERANRGAVYMTYQWWIGACNELVAENLSPITKTPEYKYCAVTLEAIADQAAAEAYVVREYDSIKRHLRESAEG
ncbi:Formate dehydrogenase H [Edwardsiella tarda]|uniref:Formate dehydrogenase, alpha subunit n=2 Tax=Edwardsiella tarda TaxID=636 RepID=D4F1L3_EDWTA|nr:formate dehydrogenase, alpha subunit [Edwardsiella tarda ATCC 23685]SPW34868.1 Formate dehydrogenase H [Edwardsiella tarda]STD28359.1 Formate dehydrogenase H [Edwardsiella tarda]STD41139.1 Formate dehydrogenase H [Edwardsiella tarda]